jgi:uncharacterized protein YeaO (DUF488 family)
MAVRIVRLGAPRERGEGVRLGAVRRPPRGVRKEDYAKRDYFDLWFPELGPSPKLLAYFHNGELTDARWARYVERYRREKQAPEAQRVLELLARLSHQADFSIGCYCAREDRCHRSIVRDLLMERGAKVAATKAPAKSRQAQPKAIDIDACLREAIAKRRLVSFTLDGFARIAEPHDYGLLDGVAKLFFYQVGGESKSGKPQGWRWGVLDKIADLKILEKSFSGPRPAPTGRHIEWEALYATVSPRPVAEPPKTR